MILLEAANPIVETITKVNDAINSTVWGSFSSDLPEFS